ncbi:M20 family metallo-hydrolase [Corynebacterium accolens]|uniref:M20 family metallo-hydrolase n=1 Tax=Corynebacterium accolens TaxID=38284 RepID=UPI002542C30F|nr:M20 family metallo-hydrolase [Corynebacterium accolens]MDK4338032.1 M20 family metallo-hydrolase [Corynebacterium accolens]
MSATSTQDTPEFIEDFHTMSSFGATSGGGIDRQAATDEDAAVRRWFHTWLESHDFRVEYDEIGNQYGLLSFIDGADFVLTGSHMDSQPLAGRFDGSYGVLASAHAALEVKRRVEAGELTPTHNLAVVNWFNEEGSRFTPSMMGSSVYTGKMDLTSAYESTALDGTTARSELERHGFIGSFTPPKAASYAEIHVEQGRGMDNSGATIGLVAETWGAKKFQVTVRGEQGHTGSTLLADRQDALFGASLVISELRRYAEAREGHPLQASVSTMKVLPNSPVTIAREVQMNLDLRSPDWDTLNEGYAAVRDIVSKAELEAKVKIELTPTHEWKLSPYQPEGVHLADAVATELGLKHEQVQTVAGHDSTNMKDTCPTVMLFIPSVDGISHNEAEFTKDEDMEDGVRMMTATLTELCQGALNA